MSHDEALDAVGSDRLDAERLAHRATGAIGTDQVTGDAAGPLERLEQGRLQAVLRNITQRRRREGENVVAPPFEQQATKLPKTTRLP